MVILMIVRVNRNPHLSRPRCNSFLIRPLSHKINRSPAIQWMEIHLAISFLDLASKMSIFLVGKTVNLHESFKMQLRAEATNAFNIISYSNPGATVNTTNLWSYYECRLDTYKSGWDATDPVRSTFHILVAGNVNGTLNFPLWTVGHIFMSQGTPC